MHSRDKQVEDPRDLTEAKGLKVLQQCNLEHCIALSGELELYSQMLGPVDTNLLNMLREVTPPPLGPPTRL